MLAGSLHSVLQLLVIANVVPSALILFTLMMKALRSSETSVRIRATRFNISENGIFQLTLNFAYEWMGDGVYFLWSILPLLLLTLLVHYYCLFKTTNEVLPGGSSTATRQHTNTHITQNSIAKETNRHTRPHKQWTPYYSEWIQWRNRRNK
jgi:hypothetical protein